MPLRTAQPGTLKFIAIAVVFMLLLDHFVFDGKRTYIEDAKNGDGRNLEMLAPNEPVPPPTRVEPPEGQAYFEAPPEAMYIHEDPEIKKVPDTEIPPPAFVKPAGDAKIAIIIDDLGMDLRRSREVLELPAPVTLALLPYAPKIREFAEEGKSKGHEMIIHVPMEAMDGSTNIGPGGLKAAMSAEEFTNAFGTMLGSFDGYVGINNHMGSRLTQDERAMTQLMNMLASRNLFFVDSRTSDNSVAISAALQAGIPFAGRDVFLDHEDTAAFVAGALAKVEKLAARRGYAIAIGHPKDHTIAGLKAWVPTLKEKGIEIVPVSELLQKSYSQNRHSEPLAGEESSIPLSAAQDPSASRVRDDGVEVKQPSAATTPAPEIQNLPPPEQSPSP